MRSTRCSARGLGERQFGEPVVEQPAPELEEGGAPAFDAGFDGFFKPCRLIAPESGRDPGALVEAGQAGIDRIAVDDVELRPMSGGAVNEPAGPDGLTRSAGTDREDKFRPRALGGVCVVGEKNIRRHVTSSFQVETRQKTAPRREEEMIIRRTARRPQAIGGEGQVGRSRLTSRAGLSPRRPMKTVWRSKPSSDPGQISDLGDQLQADPMHLREDEPAAEAGFSRRRNVERHFRKGEWREAAVEEGERLLRHAGSDAAGVGNASANTSTCRPGARPFGRVRRALRSRRSWGHRI